MYKNLTQASFAFGVIYSLTVNPGFAATSTPTLAQQQAAQKQAAIKAAAVKTTSNTTKTVSTNNAVSSAAATKTSNTASASTKSAKSSTLNNVKPTIAINKPATLSEPTIDKSNSIGASGPTDSNNFVTASPTSSQ